MASPAGPCWRPSPPGSATPRRSRSWPAAPRAARSPGSKRPSTAPSGPKSTPPSWRWCSQVAQSGGKRKGAGASGRGNRYVGAALGEAAISAARTQTFPGAKYRRLVKRMPKKKALVATGNSLLAIYHALLSDPEAAYTDLGTDYHDRRASIRRQARNHLRGLERLGYKVTIEPIDPATGELEAAAS